VELGLAAGRLCRDYFLCSGYLCKQEGFMRSWRMRWCALKDDNFLYFYKHEAVSINTIIVSLDHSLLLFAFFKKNCGFSLILSFIIVFFGLFLDVEHRKTLTHNSWRDKYDLFII